MEEYSSKILSLPLVEIFSHISVVIPLSGTSFHEFLQSNKSTIRAICISIQKMLSDMGCNPIELPVAGFEFGERAGTPVAGKTGENQQRKMQRMTLAR
jgi:hypothetical protein